MKLKDFKGKIRASSCEVYLREENLKYVGHFVSLNSEELKQYENYDVAEIESEYDDGNDEITTYIIFYIEEPVDGCD